MAALDAVTGVVVDVELGQHQLGAVVHGRQREVLLRDRHSHRTHLGGPAHTCTNVLTNYTSDTTSTWVIVLSTIYSTDLVDV